MLNSKYDDDLLYLIRFKEFIDKNDAIQEILNNLWIGLPENYSREFIIKDKNLRGLLVKEHERPQA